MHAASVMRTYKKTCISSIGGGEGISDSAWVSVDIARRSRRRLHHFAAAREAGPARSAARREDPAKAERSHAAPVVFSERGLQHPSSLHHRLSVDKRV
jgi:hypothetical protein